MIKKITLFCAVIFVNIGFAQFTATYSFDSVKAPATNPVVIIGSGRIDPSPLPTATGVIFGAFTASDSVSTQPTAPLRFSFKEWSTGATSANDVYSSLTGALDTSRYYEVTIAPALAYNLTLSSITFIVRRSGTGIRTYSVRSSSDNFTSNLPASISPSNSKLTVQSGNIFFWTADATTTAQLGSTISLSGSAFTNAINPVTFRFYAWNAEASTGSFSIDDVKISGSVTSALPSVTTDPQDATICVGSPTKFSVEATNAVSYQWEENPGAGFVPLSNTGVYSDVTTDTLRVSNSTGLSGYLYRCVVTNTYGNDTSNAATLLETTPLTPSVTVSNDTTICEFSELLATAVGVNAGSTPSYNWMVVELQQQVGNGQILSVPAGNIAHGTYHLYCELMSSIGCVTAQTATDTLIVTANPLPVVPLVSQAGADTLYTSSYSTYQWYYGVTAIGTDSSVLASQSGVYTVSVTNAFGCSAISSDYNFVNTGVASYNANLNSAIYPNPSNDGLFTLDLGNAEGKTIINVYNVIGKVIMAKEIVANGKYLLNLSAATKGCYFVSVKNDKKTVTHKITITK